MSDPDLLAKYREAYWAAMRVQIAMRARCAAPDYAGFTGEEHNTHYELWLAQDTLMHDLLKSARGEAPEDLKELYKEYGDE